MARLRLPQIARVLAALALVGSLPVRGLNAQEKPTGGLSRAGFDRLRAELRLDRQPWAAIPWKVSVTEARRQAAREGKPVFLVVNTGNCLGFV
jgi:hypothetical protein